MSTFLNGTIDLLQSGGGKVDIIDFKNRQEAGPEESSFCQIRKPASDLCLSGRGKTEMVGKLLLYFTGETEEPLLAVEGNPAKVEERMKAFDHTARRITGRKISTIGRKR